jgi:hypothetical protein
METRSSKRAAAAVGLTAFLVLSGGNARADDHPVVTLIPEHLFAVRGFSFRQGDWLSLEPSFLFVPASRGAYSPVVVVRPMLGVGGSGVGIGLAPIWGCPGPCDPTDALMLLPVSLEARIERMYGVSDWRSATYLGPHISISAYILKASVGWMVDVNDRSDHHIQLAIGGGF